MANVGHNSGEASPLDDMCDDLSTLYEQLFPARAKWCNIGLKLKVTIDTLEAIASKHNNPDDCLREMLAKRLQDVGSLSWREVCDCLRSPTVDCNNVAEKIEECKKDPTADVNAANTTSQSFATQVHSLPSPPVTGLTIETLKREIKFTDEQLDTRVEETDLLKLSSYFDTTHDGCLAMGLSSGQQTDVRSHAFVHGTQAGMLLALKYWLDRVVAEGTFRALLLIILSLDKGDIAINVAQYLSAKDSSNTNSEQAARKNTKEPVESMSDDRIITDLTGKIDFLETKFQRLTNKTLKRLKQSRVSVDDFYASITGMKLSLKSLAGKYIEECFEKARTLAKIWGKLNRFWDFFNYELFRHVLRVMFTEADDPLLSQLAEYESEMDGFLSSTKLSDFFKVWPFSIDSPQEKEVGKLKNVIVRVNKSWDDCTLRDVKNISNTFAQGFFLPREFLLVAGVGKSSVSILWSVPPSLASSIVEQVKQGKEDFLADNGFLSITIDGVQVYSLTPMKQASLRLKKMYVSRQISKNLLQPYKLALITTGFFDFTSPNKYIRHTLRGDKDDIHCNKFATTLSTLGHHPNGSPARLVLVEGAPGVGKTTFSLEACIKWANKELLKDTTILFLLPLRDFNVQNIHNLDELVSLINPGDKSLVEELEANKGEGTAFWLDGWDEIASTLDDQSCFLKKLVSGEILPKARVIVTSRPWATDYIKKRKPSQHIEIVASVQDQIDWLIELKKKYPQKSSALLEQFLKYLDETPAVKGHMHTPLATSITLLVYQWCQESSSTLPATVTQLYTAYTCFCIHGYLDKHPHFVPKLWKSNNFSDLSEPLKTFFHSLSGISLNGLLDNVPRLVFPDLPDHLRLETLGLMQTVDPLYTSAVVSYHFNHLTLQEYLAAFSLSQMSDEERSAIVARCIHDGHFTGVLRFLSGLTKSSPILRDHMRRKIGSRTVFHWLFEGGDKASITDILGESEISIRSDYSWSPLDYFVTGYCIARSNCFMNFEISGIGDENENMSHLFQAFCSAGGEQGNASITSIKVSCSDLASQSF